VGFRFPFLPTLGYKGEVDAKQTERWNLVVPRKVMTYRVRKSVHYLLSKGGEPLAVENSFFTCLAKGLGTTRGGGGIAVSVPFIVLQTQISGFMLIMTKKCYIMYR